MGASGKIHDRQHALSRPDHLQAGPRWYGSDCPCFQDLLQMNLEPSTHLPDTSSWAERFDPLDSEYPADTEVSHPNQDQTRRASPGGQVISQSPAHGLFPLQASPMHGDGPLDPCYHFPPQWPNGPGFHSYGTNRATEFSDRSHLTSFFASEAETK